MKLGIIGTSIITEKFINAVINTGVFELNSIYSRTKEKGLEFGKKFNCVNVVTTFEELVSSGIEVVYIASPNSLHMEHSQFFLEHKIYVICEKPMALNFNEFESLFEIAEQNNSFVFEAFRHINGKHFENVKQVINGLGSLNNVTLKYCQYSSKFDNFKKGEVANVFNKNMGGGALLDLGVYPISFAVALWGMPKGVLYKPLNLNNGVDGAGSLIMEYEGFLCSVVFSKIGEGVNTSEIIGENGTLVINTINDPRELKLYKKDTPIQDVSIKYNENDMEYEVSIFGEIIKENNKEKYKELKNISEMVVRVMDMARG